MAELEIELNLGGPMRKAMIEAGADLVDALPTYRYAIILELLRRDPIARCLIAEAIGEEGLRVTALEKQRQRDYDAGTGDEPASETTWDEIALKCISDMQDTPGGRGEVDG